MYRIIIALLFLLIGCATSSNHENKNSPLVKQVIRINSRTEPMSLDPRKFKDLPTSSIVKTLFEGLMRIGPEGNIIPATAETVEISDDKTTYTFHLRDTQWINGDDVTAFDFEYSWKSTLNPQFAAPFANSLYVLKNGRLAKKGLVSLDKVGVNAIDDHTLVVELENPAPYFLELTATPIFFPVHAKIDTEQPTWSDSELSFISNGPFKLASWQHGNLLEVIKNDSYWDHNTIVLSKIAFTMIEDEHTELNMFENGELDWAGSPLSSIPPEAIEHLKHENRLQITPMAEVYCYKFNTKSFPFDNVKIRKAFTYAMNRKKIIDNITQANQVIATGLIPPMMLGYEQNYFVDGDIAIAQKLFQEALDDMGINKEDLPPITLSYTKSEKHQKITQALQQQWQKAFGINIKLYAVEWNVLLDKLHKHDFQIAGRGWVADFLDPINLLEMYKYCNASGLTSNNDTQWENSEFVKLLDDAEACPDHEKRLEMILQAERLFIDEMPVAPLFHTTNCYLTRDNVKNIILTPTCNFEFRWAYIDNEKTDL